MAVVFAIYGFIDLMLLLATKVMDERMMPMIHSLGISKNWRSMRHKENAIERPVLLEESNIRWTKINAKGQVTIPADLRERFGLEKGTPIDWTRDGTRLVLSPIRKARKKS
ncbi:MAG: AbrB/MazE/SpoVT family DNA-binding domain-containing protein [Terriglobales bacterium]